MRRGERVVSLHTESLVLPPNIARLVQVLAALLVIVFVAAGCGGGSVATASADSVSDAPEITPFTGLEPVEVDPDEEGTAPVDLDPGAEGTAPVDPDPNGNGTAPVAPVPAGTPELLRLEVLETLPHDPNAYTQGLLFDGDGLLLESTGLRSESDLRRVRPDTGEVVQIVAAPLDYFAEGLTQVGDELIQLTWQDGVALYWDAASFELKRSVPYTGEGWGLCFDGGRLVSTLR